MAQVQSGPAKKQHGALLKQESGQRLGPTVTSCDLLSLGVGSVLLPFHHLGHSVERARHKEYGKGILGSQTN